MSSGFVLFSLSRAWGTTEAASLAAAEIAISRGLACTVVALGQSPLEIEARTRAINCLEMEVNSFFSAWTLVLRLRDFLRLRPSTTVFCPRPQDLLWARIALLGRKQVRLVTAVGFACDSCLSSESSSRFRSTWSRWVFSRVDALIANSQAQKNLLLRTLPVPAGKVPVLIPSIDLQKFGPQHRSESLRASWGLQANELTIGALAQDQSSNFEGGLLQALAIVSRNKSRLQWKLLIAASGPRSLQTAAAQNFYKNAVLRLGEERVILLPSHISFAEFCASLDLFVAGEQSAEGSAKNGAKNKADTYFDLRWLEAMASGAATLAPAAGAVPELAKDARAALLWRSGNPWDLARQLERAMQDPSLRVRLSAEGRSTAKIRHDPERFANQFLRLIHGPQLGSSATSGSASGSHSHSHELPMS